jgi:thiol:disulfide interchange protein
MRTYYSLFLTIKLIWHTNCYFRNQKKLMMLLKIFALVSVLLVSSGFADLEEEGQVNWKSIDEAQKLSSADGKSIFIDFTADWCGWCKVMDKNTFSDPSVAVYMNDHFYSVRLDYDSKEEFEFFGEKYTARQLGDKYKVPGLPTILLVSSGNAKSKKLVGYKKAEPFLEKLQSFTQ